jgi:hypothetical protein
MELQDKNALLALSLVGYELWVAAKKKSSNYECIEQAKKKVVRRKGFTEGGREVEDGTKCTCVTRVAYISQCEHLVEANDGRFIIELWDTHWLQNFKKTGSKYVLNRLPKAALNNIDNTYICILSSRRAATSFYLKL